MRNHFMPAVLIIALTACAPQPAPPAGPFYTTGFGDAGSPTPGWTQTQSRQADISIQGGRLHIVLKQPDTLAWSAAGLKLGDMTLEVDAEPLDGPDDNSYGLIARRVDDENLYSFQISGDGYFIIQKRLKAKWVNLTGDWQAAPAIHPGRAANHLRVTCKGSLLTFTVNGVQLAQVTDKDFSSGDIGVIAGALAESGVHVAFDNVTVTKNP